MYVLIRVIAWSVWGVVGLLFWIPFLARTMFGFNCSLVYATVTGNPFLIARARESLDFATALYVMGFRNIEEWTDRNRPETWTLPHSTAPSDFKRFLFDVLWAAIWWGAIVFPEIMAEIVSALSQDGFGVGWMIFVAGLSAGFIIAQLFRKGFKEGAAE